MKAEWVGGRIYKPKTGCTSRNLRRLAKKNKDVIHGSHSKQVVCEREAQDENKKIS